MPLLEVRDLAKSFGEVKAVRNISFEVEEGEIFGLLGPNGAGKTTTMRMIYGVLRPDRGEIRAMGIDVIDRPVEARRHMGVLPEDTGLYPRLTAEENLVYFGKLKGMEEAELRRRIRELLEILSLEDKRFTIADKLSRGQRQKLAFARAIINDPPILLLDEPTLGVDVVSAREIRRLIMDHRGEGRAIVLSTHNMLDVERLCDRVGIVNDGQMVYVGSKEELERLTGEEEFEEIFVRLVRGETIEKAT